MWIKICGVRDEPTAEQVCRLAPDAIGLNFFARSPRHVTREAAAGIADVSGERVQRIGVFVNHPVAEIEDLAGAGRLAGIQLHGDESVEQIAEIVRRVPGVRVYRAWRMGESLAGLASHLAACAASGILLGGCLIDSCVPGVYGGSGQTVSWDRLARDYERQAWPPLILAGGLNPDNVAAAIQAVHPWGVDVASGVESAPGVKDLDLVRRFIEAARTA